jgi:CrcB protein
MNGALSPSSLLLVAAGGAAGSVLRYLVSVLAAGALGTGFPFGTLAVNVAGSALIGVAAGWGVSGGARLLLVTGLLGGFTTFSAFSLETAALHARAPLLAALYVGASVVLGLAAFALGMFVTRR